MAASGIAETVSAVNIPKLGELKLDLYIIKVPPDGSCFFHSILRAFHKEYITATTSDIRKRLCRKLRDSTAESLQEVNPITNKTEYDTLGNGYYKNFNDAIKDVDGDIYSLNGLQRELLGNGPVDHAYIEILSNHLELDIYLISAKKGDVYLTGTDTKLLYKGRRSIVIFYTTGHYDILGIKRPGDEDIIFDSLFLPTHPLILAIGKRIIELTNKKSPAK